MTDAEHQNLLVAREALQNAASVYGPVRSVMMDADSLAATLKLVNDRLIEGRAGG